MRNRGEVFDYAANNCGIELDGFVHKNVIYNMLNWLFRVV